MQKPKLTLREIIFEGIKKFAGEIIGVVLLACFLWCFPGLRSLFTEHTFPTKDESQAEIQRELERHKQEEERLRAELQRQIAAQEAKNAENPKLEANAGQFLEIHAVNDVWMSVAFGNAMPIYRKTLKKGEVMRWDLNEPARVTFGRATAAQVILNGKDLGIVDPVLRKAVTYIYNPDGTYYRRENAK